MMHALGGVDVLNFYFVFHDANDVVRSS
jgi:hypothetical protein